MSRLTMVEAYQDGPRPTYLRDYQVPVYFVDQIDLYFELNEEITIVKSCMQLQRNPASASQLTECVLNGDELTLVALLLNGKPLRQMQYDVTPQQLIIYDVPDQFTLEVTTKIELQKNTALSGLYRSGKVYCTQCEAEGFRRITYFPDRPDVLARFTTTLSADESRYPILLSNGNLLDSGRLENGRHWAKWHDPFKKPSYLFALVAGDFDVLTDQFMTMTHRSVTLRLYVEKGYIDQTQHAMEALKKAMYWDEQRFGREYDLDIYMIVAISDFNMGAMENKGLNIFNTKYLLVQSTSATDDDFIHMNSVIAHEYFHNWTGNRVTCRDWFQLSLKEGLTIFRDQCFSEDMFSQAVMRIRDVINLREAQFPEDAGPLAHPVCPDSYIEINNFYTATVYNKGAEVLRMLQTILGPTLFRKGMDLYFERYDGQAVTIEDYVQTMEAVSGMNLTQFRLWYHQAGTPVVVVEEDYDVNKQIYTLTVQQSCPPTPGQPEKQPFHIPIRVGLLDKHGKEMLLRQVDEPGEVEKVLHLKETMQVFRFEHVTSMPIPSLLRRFSAPVKLYFPYADKNLLSLVKHDQDAFNRWEAGQKYALSVLLRLIGDYQQEGILRSPDQLPEIFKYILQDHMQDKLLQSEMLRLPSERYIGEQMDCIDVDAIYTVREFTRTEIAKQLRSIFFEQYNQCKELSSVFDKEAIGERQMKNLCLAYLMLLPDMEIHQNIGKRQFTTALTANMTDTIAALSELVHLDSPLCEQTLRQFYSTWQHHALVIDKWFAVQAMSKRPTVLEQVKKLTRHEAFDIRNPNRVYALIGTFSQRNLVHFHAKSGEGYAFLREMVLQLDELNPQVAARMIKPLTQWKRYDEGRQTLMQEQLTAILQGGTISKDLYELVAKSLE